MHILYVEDEPDIARLVSRFVQDAGMTIECVPNTESALLAMRRAKPDVLLLDIMLPGEDGYSFCRRLRGDPLTRDLPIAILSARTMPFEVQRGYDCGADVYIAKPFERAALIEGIRQAAAARRKT